MIMAPVEAASSDQIHLQRLLSTRTWQEGFKSQIVCTCISWCARVTLILLGLGLFTYYKQNPDPALLKLGGDGALFRFISTKLPGPVSALFVAAMLAAIMSTLSSGLNSMATIYLKEIHGKFINKKMDDKKELQVSRYATLWIGIVTMGLGLLIHSSGQWFSQSMAEVGAIFGILGAATIPAFLFAVLSSRASTKLIWGYAFFAFGEVISKNIWYALSTTSFLAWKADPSAGFGWAGKQEPTYLLLTVAFMAVSGFPYLIKSLRSRRIVQIMAFGSITAAGLALGLLEWYFFSNFYIVDQPMARSFAFHFPFGFIGAFIILWFCPVQPEKKYKGLTVSTLGHPIAALEDKQ